MSKTYNKNCIAKPSYEKHSMPNNNKKVDKEELLELIKTQKNKDICIFLGISNPTLYKKCKDFFGKTPGELRKEINE